MFHFFSTYYSKFLFSLVFAVFGMKLSDTKIRYAPLIHVCTELQTKLSSLNCIFLVGCLILMNQMILPTESREWQANRCTLQFYGSLPNRTDKSNK